jgi:hypothetical protein
LALEIGGLNVANHWTMDYELWGKFFLAGATFKYTHVPFGMFRVHDQQKTAQGWATTRSLIATAVSLVTQARDLPESLRDDLSRTCARMNVSTLAIDRPAGTPWSSGGSCVLCAVCTTCSRCHTGECRCAQQN